MSIDLIVQGTIIHSIGRDKPLQVIPNASVGVCSDGKIAFVLPECADKPSVMAAHPDLVDESTRWVSAPPDGFIIPGLIDTHAHAPQFRNCGLALDLPLLEWLNKYTFPTEARFKDVDYADLVYRKVVETSLAYGTTCIQYFATNHLDASVLLAEIVRDAGQRAFIGKVSCDQNSSEDYMEDTETAIDDVKRFIERVKGMSSPLVTPVVTPRFAPSCTQTLLEALGSIAKESGCPIQSHVSESLAEVEWVKSLFPWSTHYSDVYDQCGLLTSHTVMAHGVYLTDEELDLYKSVGAGVSHCPLSNFCLTSGVLDARKVLSKGVKIGLGTDVSGGFAISMLESFRYAMTASKTKAMGVSDYSPLTYHEGFYLATLGGAELLNVSHEIGNIVEGKQFDALVVNASSLCGLVEPEPILDTFQRFLYSGDDRNISHVFVAGKRVAGNAKPLE